MDTKEQTQGGAMSRLPTGFHNSSRPCSVMVAALPLLLWIVFQTTQAASFDCNKASTVAEKLICSDLELSSLDDKLAIRYTQALVAARDQAIIHGGRLLWLNLPPTEHACDSCAAVLRREQLNWNKLRNVCPDVACLKGRYWARLAQLTGHLSSVNGRPIHYSRYVLVKGKGVEVCEAYAKNLNSFKFVAPFRGQRPINPQFKDFSKPDLKGPQDDPTGDRTYPAEKIDRFLWERDVNPVYYIPVAEWTKWRGTSEQYTMAWNGYSGSRTRRTMAGHLVGQVDIDNDGVLDNVYLDRYSSDIGAPLIVLSIDRSDIEQEKTKLVMQHPPRKQQELGEFRPLLGQEKVGYHPHKQFGRTPVEDARMGASYDIFLHKKKTYFDLWWIYHPSYKGRLDFQVGGPLRVFMIENGKTRELCTYSYQDTD